jgi:8-oxo-dGTP diphosphatase
MAKPFCYEYPRPSVTVDLAAFGRVEGELHILLIRRGRAPFQDQWALPGGFLNLDEPPEAGALRELQEETGIALSGPVAELGFFADVDRDPRGRTISLAFAAVVGTPLPAPQGGDDASLAAWVRVSGLEGLAFDHDVILDCARQWLAREALDGPLGLRLLPENFEMSEVRVLFREVKGHGRGVSDWIDRLAREGQIRKEKRDGGRYVQVRHRR